MKNAYCLCILISVAVVTSGCSESGSMPSPNTRSDAMMSSDMSKSESMASDNSMNNIVPSMANGMSPAMNSMNSTESKMSESMMMKNDKSMQGQKMMQQ